MMDSKIVTTVDFQQVVVLVLIACAAFYLAKSLFASLKAIWSGKGSCESGCGKCGFAGKSSQTPIQVQPNFTKRRSMPMENIIPLSDKNRE